ncbi:hypothetical protein NW765_015601 [Fusarium oxysporum]|nr:hypothetical protein NW765_015601 [Fusarium oxysporum]
MGSQLTPEMDGLFFSETFSVKALGSESALKVKCHWRFSPPLSSKNVNGNAPPHSKSIDLVLNLTSSEKAETNGHASKGTDDLADCTETPLGTIINKCLTSKPPCSDGSRPNHATEALIKVLMVPHDGYLCRLVGGRPLFDSTTGGYGSEGPFDAARALGIAVIVLDRPGHFMEGPKYSHLRGDFIAVDMASDDSLPQRLTAAVESRKIDGIITFSDEYVIATAKAAEMLNLETEPVESIITAHYKDATRKVLNTPNMQSFRLESATDLDNEEISKTLETLKYPLVIKPCRGGASRGVKRVQNHHRLREAIDQLEQDGLTKYGILLETYISGPEIDANIALWDGELMFAEITDDFPCTADASDATIADSFGETVMVSPTLLCQKEQKLVKSSLHQTLLKLGFRNGVFHVEARVQNSSMQYQEIDGLVDLADTDILSPSDPEVYLIEIFARYSCSNP